MKTNTAKTREQALMLLIYAAGLTVVILQIRSIF